MYYPPVPPSIWVPTQAVGVHRGGRAILDCHIEAFPLSDHYFLKDEPDDEAKFLRDAESGSEKTAIDDMEDILADADRWNAMHTGKVVTHSDHSGLGLVEGNRNSRKRNKHIIDKSLADKYDLQVHQRSEYKVQLRLVIHRMSNSDFGTYRCLAKNKMGSQESIIKVYGKLDNSYLS